MGTLRVIPVILILFLLWGCGKTEPISAKPTKPADKIIATVNGEPIYLKDFKLALALRVKEDPSFKVTPNTLNEQVDKMVTERLRLQGKERNTSDIKLLK